ncbi:predicted protein [Nematostella vectensis]|uniref:Uncharacterized protein n=1 Tax=Nematostella vectensis TaxID=45351 RepID=A7RL00_NEMVE|nr:predicted protein [Nematostella vectensis]|eukprot:XP_001639911.1 predicted protein [Nematostella vectensis]
MGIYIDGQWSPWASWTTCSRPCGGGLQSRARTCSNPRPSYRGKYCVGDSLQRQRCNEQKCEARIPEVARPINGQWSSWEGWQACSKSCGGGVQKRMRKCNNPIPSNGGRTCRGRDLDERACNIKSCPHSEFF